MRKFCVKLVRQEEKAKRKDEIEFEMDDTCYAGLVKSDSNTLVRSVSNQTFLFPCSIYV